MQFHDITKNLYQLITENILKNHVTKKYMKNVSDKLVNIVIHVIHGYLAKVF